MRLVSWMEKKMSLVSCIQLNDELDELLSWRMRWISWIS